MDRFSRTAFLAAPDAEARDRLCRELERALGIEPAGPAGFHGRVAAHVDTLKSLGHELFSFDEATDFEIWCPDWTRGAEGLTVEFHSDGTVLASFRLPPQDPCDR